MPRTGQYRGHAWTHRSEFQKTKGYGEIDVDECIVTGVKTFGPDSDDELSTSQRAIKRRRIARLAEGYLRGEPLLISSARPCPQALNQTIAWHRKSSTKPAYQLPQIRLPPEPAQIWEEVEDDEEVLSRLLQSSKTRPAKEIATICRNLLGKDATVENVTAQASCQPQRRLRAATVSAGPSEEALQKAAALRDRKGRLGPKQMPAVVGTLSDAATPVSYPTDCIRFTQSERVVRSRQQKQEWLSRRKSRFSFGGAGERDVANPASSPCVAPSSAAPPSPEHETAVGPEWLPGRSANHDLASGSEPTTQHREAQFSTEGQERFEEPMEVSNHGRKGITAARKQPIMSYLQAPSTQNGSTPLMYRKRTMGSRDNDARQTPACAPTTRRSTRRRITFPSSEDVQPSDPVREEQEEISSRPPLLDMSFEPDYSFGPKLNMALVEEHTNKVLPVEATSQCRPSSLKKALRRQLRDSGAEITRLDSETASSSRAADSRQPSSQETVHPNKAVDSNGRNPSRTSDSERRQTWLGTQAMVDRAERELFTSPEKARRAFTPINEHPCASRLERTAAHTPASQERGPLKQLSQEPAAPSTQAMIDTFGGFSTVKKPRHASMQKDAPEDTPLGAAKAKALTDEDLVPHELCDGAATGEGESLAMRSVIFRFPHCNAYGPARHARQREA